MNILMIGGTAFFGRRLVNKLVKTGHDITLLSRGNSQPEEFWSRVKHINCDRRNYREFHAKLHKKEFDVVIDTVSMNQQDMESIIYTFSNRKKPPHYLFCSTIAVYGGLSVSNTGFLEEEATFELQNEDDWKIKYANDKRTAEKYLKVHHSTMPYTILRPTVIEGPNDPYKRTWFWIQRLQDGGSVILSEADRHTLYRHVYVEDVAEAFFLAVENKKYFNQVYNVAGEEILTIEQYLKFIAEILNKEVKICWASPGSIASLLPNYSLPAFYEQVRLIPNIDKINVDLDYKPTSIQQWMKQTVEFFRNETENSLGYTKRNLEQVIVRKCK